MKPENAVIVLTGEPGCGKSTLIKRVILNLAESLEMKVAIAPVSDALSIHLDESPTIAHDVRLVMEKGLLVDDAIVNPVFMDAVGKLEKSERGMLYVFDGAPRTMGQVQNALVEAPRRVLGVNKIVFVRFKTPRHICGYRVAMRKRPDDTEEAYDTRVKEYETKTLPALMHVSANLDSLGVHQCEVNGQFIMQSSVLYQQMIKTLLAK